MTKKHRISAVFRTFIQLQVLKTRVQPLIFKKVMNLRPVYTLIALLAGGCFFGMIGIILAPILAAIVQLAYRSYLFAKCTETVGTWETVWYNPVFNT